MCSPPSNVQIPENNRIGDVVVTIAVQEDVTLEFTPPAADPNPFSLNGNNLTAAKVFDYEVLSVMTNNTNKIKTHLCVISTVKSLEHKICFVCRLKKVFRSPSRVKQLQD